jgi:SEC-C motif-containing protein
VCPAAPPAACPCGSGLSLAGCCGPLLGGAAAATAEALMRSRYTAYVLGDERYLLASWHRSTRPAAVPMEGRPAWCGLELRATVAGRAGDAEGRVEFVARYTEGGRPGVLHETSRFIREGGHWYYLDGRLHAEERPGRNAPCPCGSGRKFKRCCAE